MNGRCAQLKITRKPRGSRARFEHGWNLQNMEKTRKVEIDQRTSGSQEIND